MEPDMTSFPRPLVALATLAVVTLGASASQAHGCRALVRADCCCCHRVVAHRHIARVRTVIRSRYVYDEVRDQGPAPAYAPPAEGLQLTDTFFTGGVGPAFIGGGGASYGYVTSTGSASATAQARVSASIAVSAAISGHGGGHGGGRW
jgi:hypothetical protein